MRLATLIACAVVLIVTLGCARAAEPKAAGKHGNFGNEKITVGDDLREYRLVVPRTVDLKKPSALVIAFHGILIDSKDFMPRYTKLNETAEKYKFIIVYPEAIDRAWGIAPAKVKKDLAFFDAMLKKIDSQYRINNKKVYVLGMSNGGYFAHLVGKERSKLVAAVASHSGPLGLQTLLGINAERKFPVLIIHGSKDNIFPVKIARENRDKYKKEGHEVKYVEVPGLTHLWASDADINEIIVKFFKEHPLK